MASSDSFGRKRRIVLHDGGGFAFPVQLSRELARRGHDVLHLVSDLDVRGGSFRSLPGDPPGFQVEMVSIREPLRKYDFARRSLQEVRYGGALQRRVAGYDPDVVLNANTAPVPSLRILSWARRNGRRYVHWMQDIYSLAARRVFGAGGPARLAAATVRALEGRVVNRAEAVIVISEDFQGELASLRFRPKRVVTIPNWMPLDEMRPTEKDNPWSRRHGLSETTNLMYVGTLGLKHDASLFRALSAHFRDRREIRIVLVGGGPVYDSLRLESDRGELPNLVLLGWQEYAEINLVFGAADVLLATVAPDSARFSVPCKVLSYLCAGRPVLAAIPADNLMHRILVEHELGLAADPGSTNRLVTLAESLVDSEPLRSRLGSRARAFAERSFDIHEIGNRFEDVLLPTS